MRIENRGTDAVRMPKPAETRRTRQGAEIRENEDTREVPREDSMEVSSRIKVEDSREAHPPLEGLPAQPYTREMAEAASKYVGEEIRANPDTIRVHGLDVKRVQELL